MEIKYICDEMIIKFDVALVIFINYIYYLHTSNYFICKDFIFISNRLYLLFCKII